MLISIVTLPSIPALSDDWAIETVEFEGIVSRSSSFTLSLQMKLSELPVSIRASSFVPQISRGTTAFWSLCGDAATVGIGEVLLTADRDAEKTH